MVSYFNPVAMYRQQSHVGGNVSPSAPQYHHPNSPQPPTWYGGYHPQAAQINPHQTQYCMQDVGGGQQVPPGTWPMHHPMFHQEYTNEFTPIMQAINHGNNDNGNILPSPPNTGSPDDISHSSSQHGGSVSPPQNIQQGKTIIPPMMPHVGRRSPFEWMKKPSYQNQPNPGKFLNLYSIK